jgi:flagellar FliJ protein
MAQFKFKLQPVLRHRETIERERQRDYALALAKLKDLQDQLAALNQHLTDTKTDVRDNHLTGRLDVNFITAHRRYLLGVQRKAMTLVTEIATAQREAETARQHLAEAAKQKKILEKLREKQQQRWNEDLARKEAAQLDEVGIQIHATASLLNPEP